MTIPTIDNLVSFSDDEPTTTHRQFDVKISPTNNGFQMVSVGWKGANITQYDTSTGDSSYSKDLISFPDSVKLTQEWRARLAVVSIGGCYHHFVATYHPSEGGEVPGKDVRYKQGNLFYLSPDTKQLIVHPTCSTSGIFLASDMEGLGKNYLYLTDQKRVKHSNVTTTTRSWDEVTLIFSKEPRVQKESENGFSPLEKYISGAGIKHENFWLGVFGDNIGFWYLIDNKGLLGRSSRKSNSSQETIDNSLATAAESASLIRYNDELYVLLGCNEGELRTYKVQKNKNQRVSGLGGEPLTTNDIPVFNQSTACASVSLESVHFVDGPFLLSRYYNSSGGEEPKPRNHNIKQILSWKEEKEGETKEELMIGYLYQKTLRVLPFKDLLIGLTPNKEQEWTEGKHHAVYTFPADTIAADVLVTR